MKQLLAYAIAALALAGCTSVSVSVKGDTGATNNGEIVARYQDACPANVRAMFGDNFQARTKRAEYIYAEHRKLPSIPGCWATYTLSDVPEEVLKRAETDEQLRGQIAQVLQSVVIIFADGDQITIPASDFIPLDEAKAKARADSFKGKSGV